MTVTEKATAALTADGYRVTESVGRRVFWICPGGHQKWQDGYDALNGRRCMKCRRRQMAPPRKPIVIEVGHRVGDLVCLEYLGVIDGHSRVRVRNEVSGREAVMVTNQFLGGKWKLLSSEQRREISRASNYNRRGRPNPKNAKHTFGGLRDTCKQIGFDFLHPEIPDTDLLREISNSGVWRLRCHCGREFSPSINNVRTGNTRSCGCRKSESQAELLDFVQKFCPTAVGNDRQQIAPLELDVWVPEKRVAIEYCGLFWHGEKLGGPDARRRHLDKLEVCEARELQR